MAKLSNTQNNRLGGLIAVLSNREPYPFIMDELVAQGFAERSLDGNVWLTQAGINEKDRLATLAGLMVEKDHSAPLRRPHRNPESES